MKTFDVFTIATNLWFIAQRRNSFNNNFIRYCINLHVQFLGAAGSKATSFPGSLIVPPPGGGGKMRDSGNEVGSKANLGVICSICWGYAAKLLGGLTVCSVLQPLFAVTSYVQFWTQTVFW